MGKVEMEVEGVPGEARERRRALVPGSQEVLALIMPRCVSALAADGLRRLAVSSVGGEQGGRGAGRCWKKGQTLGGRWRWEWRDGAGRSWKVGESQGSLEPLAEIWRAS